MQEPGLTPTRLSLLLTSLTTLSSLHTSSNAPASSIWSHNPAATLDPLAALPVPTTNGAEAFAAVGEEWATTRVGGEGDVQVGEEGVVADEQRTAALASGKGTKAKKDKKRKSLGAAATTEMTAPAVDAMKDDASVTAVASPAKKEKKSKKKGRKSGASEAGGDKMEVDE